MMKVAHALLLCLGVMMLSSCTRVTEATVTGTWRYENDNNVLELACRADHSFTSWETWKQELTTPGVLVDLGQWHLKGRDIVVDYQKGSWSKAGKQEIFTLVKSSSDRLTLKSRESDHPLAFTRLHIPSCHSHELPNSNSVVEQKIIGSGGYIATMPHLHGPYYETCLELLHLSSLPTNC